MNEGPESLISTLVHQNAAAMKELKLGFELAKYQFLVTSERVEAGMNTVKERLKQMLVHQQRITVKEHLDVSVTSKFYAIPFRLTVISSTYVGLCDCRLLKLFFA